MILCRLILRPVNMLYDVKINLNADNADAAYKVPRLYLFVRRQKKLWNLG